MFKCQPCNKTFYSLDNLKKHIVIHTRKLVYKCKQCTSSFSTLQSLKKHEKTHSSGVKEHESVNNISHRAEKKLHVCNHCGKFFHLLFNLKKHLSLHEKNLGQTKDKEKIGAKKQKPEKKCAKCQQIFNDASQFTCHILLHIKDKVGNDPNQCPQCSRIFLTFSQLKRHVLSHTGERLYACFSCNKKFQRLDHMKRHYQKAHPTDVKNSVNVVEKHAFVNNVKHISHHVEEKLYACSHCGKNFRQLFNLKKHLSLHEKKLGQTKEKEKIGAKKQNPEKKCAKCNQIFNDASQFTCHILLHIKNKVNNRPIQCPQCNKIFFTYYHLKRHILIHTGEYPYACPSCNAKFQRSENMKRHYEREHPSDVKNNILEKHASVNNKVKNVSHHVEEKLHVCNHCGKIFGQLFNLKKHLSLHEKKIGAQKEKPVNKCGKCTQTFNDPSEFTHHILLHLKDKINNRPNQCPQCSKIFLTCSQLKRHILIHTGERPYACPSCNATFQRSDHVRKHYLREHPGDVKNNITIVEKHASVNNIVKNTSHPVEEKLYICNHCGKIFGQIFNLKRHVSLHEKRIGAQKQKPANKCARCTQTFNDPSQFTRHILLHIKDKINSHPNQCPQCSKIFLTFSQLKRHILIHTGERPYACPSCNAKFQRSDHMKSHYEREHPSHVKNNIVEKHDSVKNISHPVEEKLHVCNHCGKIFGQIFNLKKHLSIHEKKITAKKLKPENKCAKCTQTFNDASQFTRHILLHIKDKIDNHPNQCPQCNKIFFTYSQLKRHILIHTGECPYACPSCNAKFQRIDIMKRHFQRKHTEVKTP